MIQRLQTVFMVLAILMLGMFLYMPLIGIEGANGFHDQSRGWNILHFMNGWLWFINPILVGTAIGLTLISIFMYKKRSIQLLLCYSAIVFIIAAQAFVFYKYQTRIYMGDVILFPWNLFSVAALIFEALSIYYIRKDEALIKSMDRLR